MALPVADQPIAKPASTVGFILKKAAISALVALALRQKGPEAGVWLWGVLAVLALVLLLLWRYARQRNLMDVAIADFTSARSMRARLLIALAVAALSLLFIVAHLRTLFALLA